MSNQKITVPFICAHLFLDRTIYPLKGSVWFVYFWCIAIQCLSIYQNMGEKLCFDSFFFWISGFELLITLFINFMLDKFIYDHILKEDSQLIYINSKLLSGKKNKFEIGPESKIVYSIGYGSNKASQHTLYFIDSKNEKHILIDKFQTYFWNGIWAKFMIRLSKLAGIEIIREENNT